MRIPGRPSLPEIGKSVFGGVLVLGLACAALFAVRAMATPTQELIYSWVQGSYQPMDKLVQGSDGNFYGTTFHGGITDGEGNTCGTVFKMTPAGVLTTLVEFTGNGATNKGAVPYAGLAQGSDGNFYGTTLQGGASDDGTVFKMTPAGVLTTLVEFTGDGATNKGATPVAELVQGNDGNFYGTTIAGGANHVGTVFKMTPAGVLTTLLEFTDNGATNKGTQPYAGLVQGTDGNFYGATYSGGASGDGTVFKMTPAGVLTTLVEFTDDGATNKGSHPRGALVQGRDGNFYGTTYYGGASGDGTVFKMTPAGVLTTLVEFTGNDAKHKRTGTSPQSALVQGSDGNFYGTTYSGGAYNVGTIFKMGPAGALTTLIEFTGNGAINKGAYPVAGLVQGSDGNFYGMAPGDGTNGSATMFTMTPAGVLTTLAQFTANGNGKNPDAGLVLRNNGNFPLYGTTQMGGANNDGTVFKITSTGVLTTLVEFTFDGATDKGADLSAGLVLGRDGNFYGTTSQGGASGFGTVFKMTHAGVLTTLVEFTGNGAINKGLFPYARLVQGTDGDFYGTTESGGASDDGTVFKMTHAGALTTLVEFTGNGATNKGANPAAGLMLGRDGNFYGTTANGGASGFGTVFKMTHAGVLTTLVEFTDNGATNKGASPAAGLVQGSDGNFYGTTIRGGVYNQGTIFKMRPAGGLTTLVEFTSNGAINKGANPVSGLVQGSDGNFYGTTEGGGASYNGTVFKMTHAGALTTLVEFKGNGATNKGANPEAELVQASDGNFYGTTANGGPSDWGTVFRLRLEPTPQTQAAKAVASTAATLWGKIFPNGNATTVSFEYGTHAKLAGATTINVGTVHANVGHKSFTQPLSGLTPGTTYYYRIVGQNAENTHPQQGDIRSFTTAP